MKSKSHYQCKCPSCKREIWEDLSGVPHSICPDCGTNLPHNDNYSSEDANDGFFSEPINAS
jgi:rRNA maturation endonuclease Nob1